MFGDKLFNNIGFPTPADIPEEFGCRQLTIPSSSAWFGVIMGCLLLLTEEENWQQFDGGILPEEAVDVVWDIINAAYEDECAGAAGEIPTPYWDEVTETDDEFPADTQPWYGYVTDPDLPADELTFIESAGIWGFTGILALTTTPAAAILFHTIAPSFVLAMRGDSFAEVIRVIIDGKQHAEIDTTDAEDELIEIPIFGDAEISPHEILLVLKELL